MGLARQLKDEIYRCPPILVLTGRPQDAWLASWSNAEAVVQPPARPGRAARGRRRTRRGPGRRPMTDAPTWSDLFATLVNRQDLTAEQTAWAMGEIMSGEASTPRVAAFLIALKTKGETVTELTGLADTMLQHAVRISVPGRTIDIVGTGGDRSAHRQHLDDVRARRGRRRA